MNGYERRKEQKKESIRRAALELFRNHGFSRVSIDDIADKAMVSKATIYNHFTSKEGLTRDVIKTLFISLLENYRAVITGNMTFQEKLEYILFDKSKLMNQYQGELGQKLFQNDPEIQQFVQMVWQKEINQLLLDFFEEGKNQGDINPELSQESILLCFEVFINGIFATSDRLAHAEDSVRMMKDLMSILRYGLEGKAK